MTVATAQPIEEGTNQEGDSSDSSCSGKNFLIIF